MVLLVAVAANILVYPLMIFLFEFDERVSSQKHFGTRKALCGWPKEARKDPRKIYESMGTLGWHFLSWFLCPEQEYTPELLQHTYLRWTTKKPSVANAIGITLSSLIVWGITLLRTRVDVASAAFKESNFMGYRVVLGRHPVHAPQSTNWRWEHHF